ncbi:hypothetical protein DICPUDRAFT_95807 [Dictyostelium purpureum]|uniref:RCC1-like domain-containing protein n=1 Tax=Dictyostelium purpureum TaxID=5786 RepID=F1A0X8_DICPU|nr:uncharacterized protein DICPUDRAFT_95807 [Dictyostelium purpureum]EGC30154.1 hypothetical protein DICPUDRAFT_95807 [Dictyostelium purpureum]|eukprot:XP_003293316.1 hypothetical protein DICPUDRAFT_95807 [Dictyostelium purpureum]
MALYQENFLMLFGKNSHGQLGTEIEGKEVIYNQDNYTSVPMPLMGYTVKKVSCGVQHTGFITTEGKVFTFGNGSFGKLGIGHTEDVRTPEEVYSLYGVVDIECGNDHTIVLDREKRVFTWGSASLGRLGLGKTSSQLKPANVNLRPLATGVFAVSVHAGGASSGCVLSNGSLLTWGYNKYSQLGIETTVDQYTPQLVPFFSQHVQISDFSIGDRHMAAVDTNGELYTWGCNDEYQLGTGTSFPERKPTSIKIKGFQQFKKVRCGGDYTSAVTQNNQLYIWGTFVREYSSNTPKHFMDNVVDFDCSSDCGKHIIARTSNKEVWAFGWNRYGQSGSEEDQHIDTLPISKSKLITGYPAQVSTGSYHSALLYDNFPSFLAQLLWTKKANIISHMDNKHLSHYTKKYISYRDHNGDTITHLLAKKKYSYSSQEVQLLDGSQNNQEYLGPNLTELNDEGLPPFFYDASILEWPLKRFKSPINFITKDGDNCLHHFAKQGKIDEFEIAIKCGASHRLRNKNSERPFDLLDKKESFYIKKNYRIYEIGIVYTGENINLANGLKASLEENYISCCLIEFENQKTECYGYIFCVSKSSLSSAFHTNYLLNHVSKQPMISIWAEKTPIKDPSLESCIFRSQLVDFSTYDIYNDSFSILMDGIYNIFANETKTSSANDDEDVDSKLDDTSALSISGSESVFISFDPNKYKQFEPLFQFLQDNGIVIVPREKKVISSWVVIIIISESDFSPLIRDEISLAENRGKPIVPIYFQEKYLDEASRYTFSNSPIIQFNENGFKQLLLLIKLNFNLIHQTEKLLKLKNNK